MASSDNLMVMDPSWMFRNAFPDTWLPETFSRETDTLTKALQKSFETTQCFDNMNFSTDEFISTPWYLMNSNTSDTTTTTTVSGASAENNYSATTTNTTANVAVTSRKRTNGVATGGGGGGRIVKRKSRASKRATTTFINADVANFRQLVQEVTGVKFGGGEVVKPEPVRGVNRLHMIGGGGLLPTLDTSAFLLDPTHQNNREMVGGGGAPPETVVLEGGAASTSRSQFDFDSFCSFPTLESWKAI